MTHPDITALEALSRDYSETPRRVLFVIVCSHNVPYQRIPG